MADHLNNNPAPKKRRRKIKRKKLSLIVCGVVLLAVLVFTIWLAGTKLVPFKYITLIFALAFAFDVLIVVLIRKRYRNLGIFLAVLELLALFIASLFISKAVSTLKDITTVEVRESEVCIYVKTDDPAVYLQDALTYKLGFASQIDRQNVDAVFIQLDEYFGKSVAKHEYESLPKLIDGLLSNEIDAILLPSAYLDLFEDMEGYEGTADQLRLLEKRVVQVEVKREASVPATPKPTSAKKAAKAGDSFVVFISGIDNRGSLIANSRSDVNILAAVNPHTHKIALISIPRDFYVPMSDSGQLDKLTHAGMGGVEVSKQTLANLFDLDVDYYFRVNFGGFVEIIDALGGVNVYSDYGFSSRGHSYTIGLNYMDGESALVFCRERYSFSSGDRQRGKNQVAVIKAVLNKAMTMDMLTNYGDVLESMDGCFETSVPYDVIASIVQDQLSDWQDWDIQSGSVTGFDNNDYCYSLGMNAYVMTPDMSTVETARDMLEAVLAG